MSKYLVRIGFYIRFNIGIKIFEEIWFYIRIAVVSKFYDQEILNKICKLARNVKFIKDTIL